MGIYISALALIVAAVLQVTALPYLSATGVEVDLVLLLVLAWGIIRGVREGLLWGLIGGLALDTLSAVPFGVTTAVLGTVGFLGGLPGIPLLRGSALSPLFATVLATFLYKGLLMALLALFGWQWQWLDVLRDVVLPAALRNAIVMVPIYGLLFLLNRRSEPEIKW
jgi:rod shape-determining protein MreD